MTRNLLYDLPSDIISQVVGYLNPADLFILAEDPTLGQIAFDTLISKTTLVPTNTPNSWQDACLPPDLIQVEFDAVLLLMLCNKHLRFSQPILFEDLDSLAQLENMAVSACQILAMLPGQIAKYRMDSTARSQHLVDAVQRIDRSIHAYSDLFKKTSLLQRFDHVHISTSVEYAEDAAVYNSIKSMELDCSWSPRRVTDVDFPSALEELVLVDADIQWPMMLSLDSLSIHSSLIATLDNIPLVRSLTLSDIRNPLDLHQIPVSVVELDLSELWVEECDLTHLVNLESFCANYIDVSGISLPNGLRHYKVGNSLLLSLDVALHNKLETLELEHCQLMHEYVFSKLPESLKEVRICGVSFVGNDANLTLVLPPFLESFCLSKLEHRESELNLVTSWPLGLRRLELHNLDGWSAKNGLCADEFPVLTTAILHNVQIGNTVSKLSTTMRYLEVCDADLKELLLHDTTLRTLVFERNATNLVKEKVDFPPTLRDLRIEGSLQMNCVGDLNIPQHIRKLELVRCGLKHLDAVDYLHLEYLDLLGNTFDQMAVVEFPHSLQTLLLENCDLGRYARKMGFGPRLQFLSTLPEALLKKLPKSLAYYNYETTGQGAMQLRANYRRKAAVYGLIIVPFASCVIVAQNVLLTAIQSCWVAQYFAKLRLKKILGRVWRWARLAPTGG